MTIEPDDYAVGTNLQYAVPGVRLTTTHGIPVTVVDPCAHGGQCLQPAVTGDLTFGPGAGAFNSGAWDLTVVNHEASPFDPAYKSLRGMWAMPSLVVEFDNPTDFVSISGAGTGSIVSGHAYDSDGNYRGSLGGTSYLRTAQTRDIDGLPMRFSDVSITSLTANIAYAVFGGLDRLLSLDRLQFNRTEPVNVPEPSTAALFGLALVGMIAGQRRKRSS